jgi:hypothetical protein
MKEPLYRIQREAFEEGSKQAWTNLFRRLIGLPVNRRSYEVERAYLLAMGVDPDSLDSYSKIRCNIATIHKYNISIATKAEV